MQSSQHQIKLMRFSEDHSSGNTSDLASLDRQRQMLRHSHLEVSSLITPKLEDVLASVLERCAVARDKVVCFVKNDQRSMRVVGSPQMALVFWLSHLEPSIPWQKMKSNLFSVTSWGMHFWACWIYRGL